MTWTCDTCGEAIKDVGDGWVEWKSVRKPDGGYGGKVAFRLVHAFGKGPGGKKTCMYDERGFAQGESLADLPLEQFVGTDGLMTLLGFLSDNPGSEEILELIKRLHIPGYDKAFRHFDAAMYAGVFERNTTPNYHMQREINATNEWVKSQGQGLTA